MSLAPAPNTTSTPSLANTDGVSAAREQRSTSERRRSALPALRYLFFGGRRRRVRRAEDRWRIVVLDRYPAGLLVIIIGILFLSLTDAFLTLNLIEHGATEINPVMNYFLGKGPTVFTIAKYAITSAAVIIFVLVRNSVIRGSRFQTHRLFTFALVCFAIAVAWQFVLIFMTSCRSLIPC